MEKMIEAVVVGGKDGKGRKILLDTSDEICHKFGFSHGDRVLSSSGEKATIIGVGPNNEGENVLWYSYDRLDGKVCYYGALNKNLEKAGFKKLEE